ncbi:YgaP family membrane protein [Candidatus Protochlamydia amoebophila]|uniref:YgaP family membrane protein n=1 Tax=Candidatus Protochlamydia amoebophila TaxID=362787 RepID=UPI001BC9E234|nr:DUF2892 domain-containing protein [Candidatus Protochlamydia amoebophila]
MPKNIGIVDRLVRLFLAFTFLFLAWWESSWIILVFSLFIFYEAVASWCLFYQLIGKNTCPIDKIKNN